MMLFSTSLPSEFGNCPIRVILSKTESDNTRRTFANDDADNCLLTRKKIRNTQAALDHLPEYITTPDLLIPAEQL